MDTSLSDTAALARWKTGMKSGGQYMQTIPVPPKFRFVDGWVSEVRGKLQNESVSAGSPIDPWGQRRRS